MERRFWRDSVDVPSNRLAFAQLCLASTRRVRYDKSREISIGMGLLCDIAVGKRSNLLEWHALVVQAQCDGPCEGGEGRSNDFVRLGGHASRLSD